MKDKIIAIELAFDNSPAEVCKQASAKTADSRQLHSQLKKNNNPYFVLRTCRRVSVFSATSCPGKTIRFFEDLGLGKKYLNVYKGDQAITLLLEITAGLKSPNLGENEILHQLKNVLKESVHFKTLDVTLQKLLQKAIETGKRVRSETNILKNNLSYPAIIQQILKNKQQVVNGLKILVIGNGGLGKSCIKYFMDRKADVTLATSNHQKSLSEFGPLKVISRAEIKTCLSQFRVIIGAASSDRQLLDKEDIIRIKSNPPLLIDLAMPANFDPQINGLLPGKFFNLEHIFSKTRAINKEKSFALWQARSIIEEEKEAFLHWLKGRKAVQIITTLKEELEQIKLEEQNRLWQDFGIMNLQQKKIINNLVNRLTSRIAHTHYSHIKEFVVHEQS